MGKHAREDLPALMRTMSQKYASVHFEQLATAGEDPRLTELLARIALEQFP
jgi:sirohydrochlorin cobaltochelatase